MRYRGPRDVLEVDLTTRVVRRYALEDEVFAQTLGGVGLAVWLLERHLEQYGPLAPLSPQSPLVFAAGPFAATPVPAANKHALATISPLTGLLNEGLSSSHWSVALRRCGLAALIVTGIAREWSTLVVDDGEATRALGRSDAAHLCDRDRGRARRSLRLGRERRPASRARRERGRDGIEAAEGDRVAWTRGGRRRRPGTGRRAVGGLARARHGTRDRKISSPRDRGESARPPANGSAPDAQLYRRGLRGRGAGHAGGRARVARDVRRVACRVCGLPRPVRAHVRSA